MKKWYKDHKYLVGSILVPVCLAVAGWIYATSSNTNSLTNAPQNTGIITRGQTGNNTINIPPPNITIAQDQRAWVFASEIAVGGVKWKDGEARFDVLVNLKNSGHSPGLSVDVTSVACPSWNLSQLLKKQQELSERERHHPSKIGTMVFPGDAVSIKANIGLSRDDIVTFQQAIRQIDTDNHIEPVSVTSVPIGILIVIDCRLADKNEHHPNWIRDEPVLS